MENVVLVIHLVLALALIGIVLIQRSEGGGLGIGGGGGGSMSGRPPATPLSKMTWLLAIGFVITSISLTIIAAQGVNSGSVIDRLGSETPATSGAPEADGGALGGDLLPPSPEALPAEPPKAE